MHLLTFLADYHPPLFYVMMIPVAGILFMAFFMAVSLYFRNQEEKRMHETARIALEKGQPIPSFAAGWSAPHPAAPKQSSWMGLLIGGLVNIAVGSGLYVMLASMPGAFVARYCAVIPGLVGVALLLAALIVGVTSRTHSDRGGPPPMS